MQNHIGPFLGNHPSTLAEAVRGQYHAVVSQPDLDPDARFAAAMAVRRIDRWLRERPIGEPVTLLDTGVGSLSACAALLHAARNRGHALRVVSIVEPGFPDPDTPPELDALEIVRADPFALVDQFGPASFDYVLTQLRVARLREVPRLTWLRIIDRLATRGVVWIERVGDHGLSRLRVNDMIERVGATYLRVGKPLASPYFVIRGRKPAPGA